LQLRPSTRTAIYCKPEKTFVIWAEEIKKPRKGKSLKALSAKAGLPRPLKKQRLQKKRKISDYNRRASMNEIKRICWLFFFTRIRANLCEGGRIFLYALLRLRR